MTHKRLPKGSKMIGKWHRTDYLPTDEYEMGYAFGAPQYVYVEYEIAEVEYYGFGTPFIANAVRVTVWRTNGTGLTKVYRQAYYGETAEDDARREGTDHAMKERYATA